MLDWVKTGVPKVCAVKGGAAAVRPLLLTIVRKLNLSICGYKINNSNRARCMCRSLTVTLENRRYPFLLRLDPPAVAILIEIETAIAVFHRCYCNLLLRFYHRYKNKKVFTQQTSVPSNTLLASFKVIYRMAKCKKPRTIAEELILPTVCGKTNFQDTFKYLTTLLVE